MAKISIDPAKTMQCIDRMEDVARNLEELSGTLNSIRGNLGYKIATRERIALRLMDVAGQLTREAASVRSMRDALEEITNQYRRAENAYFGLTTMAQASSGGRTAQDSGDLLRTPKKEMERFISEFEEKHPEESKELNQFLKGGRNNQIDKDDIRYIKYLAYNAKEPFRSIYLKSISKHSIGNADLNGGAFYLPMPKPESVKDWLEKIQDERYHKVNYTYNNDSLDCFRHDPRGPYTTFFHETGHAIDDLSNKSQWWGSDTENFTSHSDAMNRNVTLREAIEYDVYYNKDNVHSMTSVAEAVRQSGKPGSGGNVNNVINAFQSHKDPSTLGKDDFLLYRAVKDEFQKGLQGRGTLSSKYESVTDVYGAMTHNEIGERDESFFTETLDGFVHKKNNGAEYWSDNTKAAKELWAEYFSYNMAGNTENLDALLEYFPEAAKIMEQYANALGG